MGYRHYAPPGPRLIGYDPFVDLPADHLARLVDFVVEETVRPKPIPIAPGGPRFDPRLCVKVLVFGYATGVRSSRALERNCDESLPYLFLTRGDTPSYRTLCSARLNLQAEIEAAFVGLFAIAQETGIKRVGRLAIDSTKLRANASSEAVVRANEYEEVRRELERILAEAAEVDTREDEDGRPGDTRLGMTGDPANMRDILRRVRMERNRARGENVEKPDEGSEEKPLPDSDKPAPNASYTSYTSAMLERIEAAIDAIDEAETEGRKHLCLTDPDARMMAGGREKQIRECHSFEVAVDIGADLLVVGQSTQVGNDNGRLPAILLEAGKNEPDGVEAVTADSGYFAGDIIGKLIDEGIDTCVPDTNTACDLHRGEPVGSSRSRFMKAAQFEYDAETDSFVCQAGHHLHLKQKRDEWGQQVRVYEAGVDCQSCVLAAGCLSNPKAAHRTLRVSAYSKVLELARQRFADPEHLARYRHRGEQVETIFAFLRSTLGYTRWLLRGSVRVAAEARLFKIAYQVRKIHTAVLASQKQ